MILCPVCGTENDEMNLVCANCKGYLQAKVDALDLFSTMWGVIESPRHTFKKIVIARHKNYVLFLASIFGVSLAYGIIWARDLGGWFANVLTLIGTGAVAGVPLGILVSTGIAATLKTFAKALGGSVSMRNMFAVTAYAFIPIVLSLVFVLPVEVAIFGREFFDNNPPPMIIKPVIYMVLLGFDGAAVLWSMVLLIKGTIVANGFGKMKSLAVTLSVTALTGLCTAGLFYL